jgi:hypothetical protein
MLVNLSQPAANCSEPGIIPKLIENINIMVGVWGSVICTNILCQRYLLERAKVMNDM